jgi:hypothetical protein
MNLPKYYRTFADFEREEIRPNFKVGFSMEDLVDEANFENAQAIDFDRDPLDWDEGLPPGPAKCGGPAGARGSSHSNGRRPPRRHGRRLRRQKWLMKRDVERADGRPSLRRCRRTGPRTRGPSGGRAAGVRRPSGRARRARRVARPYRLAPNPARKARFGTSSLPNFSD